MAHFASLRHVRHGEYEGRRKFCIIDITMKNSKAKDVVNIFVECRVALYTAPLALGKALNRDLSYLTSLGHLSSAIIGFRIEVNFCIATKTLPTNPRRILGAPSLAA